MIRSKNILPVLAVFIVGTILVGCDDPEKAAMKIFTDQGLVLLRPARDYIKVGGIVVLPKQGVPWYEDPYNDVTSDPKTYVDFKAVILGQTKNQSTALEAAISGITSVMPLAAKLDYKAGQTVQLSQIDTGGRRLLTTTVPKLIKFKETAEQLNIEIGNGNRVFIVQEIYTGKGITLKTVSNQSLDVSYGDGGKVPDCSSSAGSGSSSAKPGTTASSSSQPSSNNSTASTSPAATSSTSSASTKATTSAKTISSAVASATPSVSLGACKNADFALTLKTDDLIPFAVRLNEVAPKDGILTVKFGGFKFPPTSLASGTVVEKSTAVIDPGTLDSMEHRMRK